jgi:23S rRNA (cytosine1962-C5)-methyltransferase
MMNEYSLLDSGDGRKLERFGPHVLVRPCAQAVWQPEEKWAPDATFVRDEGWSGKLPEEWVIEVEGIRFRLSPTDFGHLGIFPEQAPTWRWLQEKVRPGMRVLNLFAYSGGVTLAAAKGSAEVCHVDASKGMVAWARENAALNGLSDAPIRWIVDDAIKFLFREVKRGKRYDVVVLDPPSFGRGAKGEVFKIDEEIQGLLQLCRKMEPKVVIFSCHTPGYTPICLRNLLAQNFGAGEIEVREMVLDGARPVPSGTIGRWER